MLRSDSPRLKGEEAKESDSYANDRAIRDGSGSREDGLQIIQSNQQSSF